MTLVFLLRHAHSSANAEHILAGRTAGVHLSATGRRQSRSLATRLGDLSLKSLQVSPLERCVETITPWIVKSQDAGINTRLRLQSNEGLIEADYGLWTGQKISALRKEPLWKKVQSTPSKVTFPRGEKMTSIQDRAMSVVEKSLLKKGKGAVLLVSHGDVIKAILAECLGMHLDDFQRIVVDPASVSIVDFSGAIPRVILLNDSRAKLNGMVHQGRGKHPLLGGGSGVAALAKHKER